MHRQLWPTAPIQLATLQSLVTRRLQIVGAEHGVGVTHLKRLAPGSSVVFIIRLLFAIMARAESRVQLDFEQVLVGIERLRSWG